MMTHSSRSRAVDGAIRLLSMLALLGFCSSGFLWAQEAPEDSTESMELLFAPASPGFILLGIEPASVERPGNVSDLSVTFIERTQSLTSLPKDFAVELAPYWIFAGKSITYEDYVDHTRIDQNILQSLSLSIATSPESRLFSDTSSTALAIGARFSVLRGELDKEFQDYQKRLDELYENLAELTSAFDAKLRTRFLQDSMIINLRAMVEKAPDPLKPDLIPIIEKQIQDRQAELERQVSAEIQSEREKQLREAQEIAATLKVRRIGWKIDVAGGVVFDFPQRDFNGGSLGGWGAWLTAGYDWKTWSLFGVMRYLDNEANSDDSVFDIGGRLIFDNLNKFSLSGESVYRRFPGRETANGQDNDQWRVAFIFDYAIAQNHSLSLTFGRDFKGKTSGNLLTLINLFFRFGSQRPVR